MITEKGRVVALDSAGAWVETIRRSSCQSCAVQKGCGHGLMESVGLGQSHHVRVLFGEYKPSQIHIGDEVEITISEQLLVSATLLLYILPLLTMLTGGYLSSRWFSAVLGSTDMATLLGGVVGLAGGLLLARAYSSSGRQWSESHPVISALLSSMG